MFFWLANITLNIDFRNITSHRQLVEKISPAFNLKSGDEVHFSINLNSYSLLYSDYLLLIAALVNYLKNIKIKVKGNFIDFSPNSDRSNYASRVNFFEQIGFDFDENFNRKNASGRFTEIKEFDVHNSIDEC